MPLGAQNVPHDDVPYDYLDEYKKYAQDTLMSGGNVSSYVDWYGQNYGDSNSSSSNDVSDGSNVDNALAGDEPSLSDYMRDNPGLGFEDYLKYMAQHSDEYAEKYLDYLIEQGSIDKANQYTASREDTAYQRLVQDLKSAGINPAMMFGSSASISASGASGIVKASEGANSRSIANYSKLKKLILGYMSYELAKGFGTANSIMNGLSGGLQFLLGLIGM